MQSGGLRFRSSGGRIPSVYTPGLPLALKYVPHIAWLLLSNISLKETNEIQISTKFLRLQQQPTVNLVRKLEMELDFGERRRVAKMHEFLCSQFSSLANIEGLDNTGRLIINAKVETEWGRPQVVICDAIVDRVLKDFVTRFAWRFPNLNLKYINITMIMKEAWCGFHAPEKVVPQFFIGCIEHYTGDFSL